MNPILLLPAALAALAALAVPLLLHLARRQQQVPTVFAALRWLRAKPKPRRRLRFDEWPLLAVRLLLVALLALLLARPALLGAGDARPRVLVAPGVDAAAVAAARAAVDTDARWLAPGFPSLEQPAPAEAGATASLLREFEAGLPADAPLAVLVPERLGGMDAELPRLTREVDWRVLPGGADSVDTASIAAPVLAIRHDEAHREGVRYLRAAAKAWQDGDASREPGISDDPAAPPAQGTQVLAWLRTDPPPAAVMAWVEQGGQVLLAADASPAPASAAVVWRDAEGRPLLTASASGQGRMLRFERALEPRAMPQLVEPSFPHRLRAALQPAAAPAWVAAADHAPRTGAMASPPPPRDLRPWLAVAIALLVLLERWLASSRRREALQ